MNSMSDNGVMKGKWTEFIKNSGDLTNTAKLVFLS